jgi:hypothetical protein
MLKFLLILGLILYAVYKVGSIFFKAGAASQQFRNPHKPDENLNYDPADKKDKKRSTFKGGDYIDYEEIKK